MAKTTRRDYVATFRQRILAGTFDEYLDVISSSIRARKEMIHKQETLEALATIQEGDRVKISGALRPKYLLGYEGTVTGTAFAKGKEFIEVDLDVPYVRRYSGKGLRIPPACLTKI